MTELRRPHENPHRGAKSGSASLPAAWNLLVQDCGHPGLTHRRNEIPSGPSRATCLSSRSLSLLAPPSSFFLSEGSFPLPFTRSFAHSCSARISVLNAALAPSLYGQLGKVSKCGVRTAAPLSPPPQIRHIWVIGINCVNETATMESGR